jgi:hypothetical protein
VSDVTKEGTPSLEERQRRRTEAINARVDSLAEEAGGDLARAERRAAGTIILGSATVPLIIGVLLVVIAFFLPHSGEVRGYDVLLFSDRSDQFLTTMPERIFVWLAFVGGILLTAATLISRATIVGWVNWVVCGIGVFYCFLAVGDAQHPWPGRAGIRPRYRSLAHRTRTTHHRHRPVHPGLPADCGPVSDQHPTTRGRGQGRGVTGSPAAAAGRYAGCAAHHGCR